MESFKYCYVVTHHEKVFCTCETCRTATNDSNFMTVLCAWLFKLNLVFACPVADETFEFADSDRFEFLAHDA